MSDDLPTKTYWGWKEWHKNGVLHRENDLPAITHESGHKEWWWEGKRHRDLGPAIVRTNGLCSWYKYGLHKGTW